MECQHLVSPVFCGTETVNAELWHLGQINIETALVCHPVASACSPHKGLRESWPPTHICLSFFYVMEVEYCLMTVLYVALLLLIMLNY